MTTINLATTEVWKDKQTGQATERTKWHRIIFFNRLAEIVAQYGKKGSKLYVEGRLQTRKWQDQSGQERYTTEIIAQVLQLLDSRGHSDLSTPAASSSAAPLETATRTAESVAIMKSATVKIVRGQSFLWNLL